jgi:hypothetical protein
MADDDRKQAGKADGPQAPQQDAQRRQQPGAQGAVRGASALDKAGHLKESKLRENQNALNVGADHKTPDMKKRHRGTFP